jgi:hypothetical protein
MPVKRRLSKSRKIARPKATLSQVGFCPDGAPAGYLTDPALAEAAGWPILCAVNDLRTVVDIDLDGLIIKHEVRRRVG